MNFVGDAGKKKAEQSEYWRLFISRNGLSRKRQRQPSETTYKGKKNNVPPRTDRTQVHDYSGKTNPVHKV